MEKLLLQKTELVEEQGGEQLRQVYVRSPAVVSRRIAGETLIVPVRGKVGDLASIYSFNQTGSFLWQALESPKDLAELVSAVQQEYAIDREQAERDVRRFLMDTQSVGLIESRQEVSMAAMNAAAQTGLHSSGSR